MQARTGNTLREVLCQTDILNNESVCAGIISIAGEIKRVLKLGRQYLDVQRHINANSAQVRILARLTQIVDSEVVGVAASIELAQTEVHGAGAGIYSSSKALSVSRRRKQLNLLGHFISFVRCHSSEMAERALLCASRH